MASPDPSCAHMLMARTQTVASIHLTAFLFLDVPLPLSLSITNQKNGPEFLRGVPLVVGLCNYTHMTDQSEMCVFLLPSEVKTRSFSLL